MTTAPGDNHGSPHCKYLAYIDTTGPRKGTLQLGSDVVATGVPGNRIRLTCQTDRRWIEFDYGKEVEAGDFTEVILGEATSWPPDD